MHVKRAPNAVGYRIGLHARSSHGFGVKNAQDLIYQINFFGSTCGFAAQPLREKRATEETATTASTETGKGKGKSEGKGEGKGGGKGGGKDK